MPVDGPQYPVNLVLAGRSVQLMVLPHAAAVLAVPGWS